MGGGAEVNIPIDADYLIDAYKAGQILIGTWHRGAASRDMEISAFQARMKRGEVDSIVVHDRNRPAASYRLYPNGIKATL